MSTHKRAWPTILNDLANYARRSLGADNVRVDSYGPRSETNDFWVLTDAPDPESSLKLSGIIARLPAVEVGYLYVAQNLKETAKRRIIAKLEELLKRGKNSRRR